MLANDLETGEDKRGDTAGLLKLLLAAHDITAPDYQAVIPGTAKDENMITAAPARTATEMLTGAIEILKVLVLVMKHSTLIAFYAHLAGKQA